MTGDRNDGLAEILRIFDPVNPSREVRYVGFTARPLPKRLRAHLRSSRKMKNERHRWIAELREAGRSPEIVILEVVPSGLDWREREKFWMARSQNLKNSAIGGGGGGPKKIYPSDAVLTIYGLVDPGEPAPQSSVCCDTNAT
jgi:hypothetical protein